MKTEWTGTEKGLFESLAHIAEAQPVFAGDLISKPDKGELMRRKWILYYEDPDLKIKGHKKGTGGYCITELGMQELILYQGKKLVEALSRTPDKPLNRKI